MDYKDTLNRNLPKELNDMFIKMSKSNYKHRKFKVGERASCCEIIELEIIKGILCGDNCNVSDKEYEMIEERLSHLSISLGTV